MPIKRKWKWIPRQKPKRDQTTDKRYKTKHWLNIRDFVLMNEPYCRECTKNGKTTLAKEVDHIKPVRQGGTDDIDNLQPLCKSCHAKKSNRERWEYNNK